MIYINKLKNKLKTATKKFNLPVNYEEIDSQTRREVRLQYIDEQDGKCCHCGSKLTDEPMSKRWTINESLFPKGFFAYPIHLHHNHKTGMTIGAIHSYCNAYLWQYKGE